MKIESKEQARARGVPSPDRAEALMLALSQLRQEYAYFGVSRRSIASASIGRVGDGWSTAKEYYGDDDDGYLVRIRRHRRFGRGAW